MTTTPPRRRPRRQPHPLRPPVRRLRGGLEPGHAHRRPRGPRRPPRPRAASGSGRSSPVRSSSTAATSTSPARRCSGRACRPTTPAYDVQQACGTGLEAAILVANKIALGQIESGIAGGVDSASDAPDRGAPRSCAASCCGSTAPRRPADTRQGGPRASGPTDVGIQVPGQHRAAHRPVDGRAHGASPPQQWGITREAQDELALRQPPEPRRRLRPRLLRRPHHALPRAHPRPEPARRLHRSRSSRSLKPVFGKGEGATMTAGNSTPLTDGASAVLLGSRGVGRRARPDRRWPGSSTARPPRSTTSPATRACSWRPRTPCRACSRATG